MSKSTFSLIPILISQSHLNTSEGQCLCHAWDTAEKI